MNKYLAGKKKEGYDDRKKHDDREDYDRSRKRRCNKDTILDEDRSAQEKKPRKREEGEEIKKGSRISCHKDENESTYSKRRDSKYERDSKYQNERFDKYDRYWARNDTGSHHEKGSNDHYWSKYPATEGTRSIRPNYWGDSSQDSQSQRIENKRFEDKENERLRDRKSRRGDDSEDTSRDREKKVESDDSAQKGNTDTKHDSQEERVTNNSSTRQKKTVDLLTSRTGGAYIPPAKLRMMQAQITDKSSAAYQRIAWEALKKSVHGHINKVNTGNIAIIVRELLKENIIRGRGLLCSIIQAQAASPTFTHVYAALVAVINSKVRTVQQFIQCELGSEVFLQNLSYVHIFMFDFSFIPLIIEAL
jgi:pre-mRNA-splicing factor CWC22